MVTVRPEQIAMTGADGTGLAGQVSARVFQGHEWPHRVETARAGEFATGGRFNSPLEAD